MHVINLVTHYQVSWMDKASIQVHNLGGTIFLFLEKVANLTFLDFFYGPFFNFRDMEHDFSSIENSPPENGTEVEKTTIKCICSKSFDNVWTFLPADYPSRRDGKPRENEGYSELIN